jgi:hypothetical protein
VRFAWWVTLVFRRGRGRVAARFPLSGVGRFSRVRKFIAPTSGAGPVRQAPAHPHVSNGEFGVTGRQATFPDTFYLAAPAPFRRARNW